MKGNKLNKKFLLVGLVAALTLSSTTSYAAAKAGSPCSKAKMISISAGKVYTCVKSGKKLVWNKGEVISKTLSYDSAPTPAPAPSPTASATPATTESVAQIGGKCIKQGDTNVSGDTKLICRLTSSGNRYF